jgi:hypothetical protein
MRPDFPGRDPCGDVHNSPTAVIDELGYRTLSPHNRSYRSRVRSVDFVTEPRGARAIDLFRMIVASFIDFVFSGSPAWVRSLDFASEPVSISCSRDTPLGFVSSISCRNPCGTRTQNVVPMDDSPAACIQPLTRITFLFLRPCPARSFARSHREVDRERSASAEDGLAYLRIRQVFEFRNADQEFPETDSPDSGRPSDHLDAPAGSSETKKREQTPKRTGFRPDPSDPIGKVETRAAERTRGREP